MLPGDLNGKAAQGGGDTPLHAADSLGCTAETNTTLESSYTPVKKVIKYF